jgi:hypothetical protein
MTWTRFSARTGGDIDCPARPTLRGFLLQGLVGTVAVIVPGVLGQDLPEMPLAEDEHVIQALVAQRAYAQDLLRYAWRGPGIYLACPSHGPRHARPCRQLPGRGGSAVPGARTRSPSARHAAATPTAASPSPRPPSVSPPQARSCPPRPPRSVTSTRATPPAARTSTVTVSPSAPEPPCRTLLLNSSLTSSAASSPHGCPGLGTPTVNARATRARSARPATVTLSRTALAISAPAFPGPPLVPGHRPGPPAATQGCTPDSAPPVKPGNTPPARPVHGRPWPSVKQPTVRTDRDRARIPSAMRPWTPQRIDSR